MCVESTRSRIGPRRGSEENAGPPKRGKFSALCSLKMPDAKPETGLRGFRAIALRSVFSEWKTTVQADLLHEEKEPIEWMSLHAEAERGVGGPLDRFGTRIFFNYNTAFLWRVWT